MTPRRRLAAATLGAALLGGTLVASPATAQQRDFTNAMSTPTVPDDFDVPSVTADLNRSTITLRFHTENLSADFGAMAYLAERRVASSGKLLVLEGGITDGEVRAVQGTAVEDVAKTFSGERLPQGAVTFARQGRDVVFTVSTRHLHWSGPVYVGGSLEGDATSRFVAAAFVPGDAAPTFLGPITTAADPTTTTLGLSASRQVYGQARATVLTAKVPTGVAGTVTFRDGAATLGTVRQTGGVARLSLPRTLRAGVHTLTATFAPTDRARFSPSTAATWLNVSPQATTTVVRLSKGKQKYRGKPSRAAISVSGRATGTVTVLDGRRRLKTVRLVNGRAAYTLPRSLKAGRHRITAVYRPATAGTYAGSTSRTVRLTVTR